MLDNDGFFDSVSYEPTRRSKKRPWTSSTLLDSLRLADADRDLIRPLLRPSTPRDASFGEHVERQRLHLKALHQSLTHATRASQRPEAIAQHRAAAKQTLLAFFNFLSSGTTKSYEQCCELADPVAFCVTLPALPNHQPSTGSANRTWEDLRAFQNAALPAQLQTFLQERFKGFDWSGGDLSAAAAVRESGSNGKDSEQASGGFSNHGASPPRDLWSGLQVEVQFEVMEADIVTEGLATMCRFLLQVRVSSASRVFPLVQLPGMAKGSFGFRQPSKLLSLHLRYDLGALLRCLENALGLPLLDLPLPTPLPPSSTSSSSLRAVPSTYDHNDDDSASSSLSSSLSPDSRSMPPPLSVDLTTITRSPPFSSLSPKKGALPPVSFLIDELPEKNFDEFMARGLR